MRSKYIQFPEVRDSASSSASLFTLPNEKVSALLFKVVLKLPPLATSATAVARFEAITVSSALTENAQLIHVIRIGNVIFLKLKENYDLIISSESGPAKGIFIKNKTPHVCYIHSPMRYAWSHGETYINTTNYFLRPIIRFFFKRLRIWDTSTVDNVDLYIANSINVAKRVQKYYNRKSEIVYPPIADFLFNKKLKESTKEYYLSFGALTPYKKIDLLVNSFNQSGKSLIIIGEFSG